MEAHVTRVPVAGGQTLERRVVGLPTAIGTTFSLIVASSVLATVAGGFFASWVWLIALAIGFLTMILASMSFSELATMIPKAGSMNEYARAGLGPFFATVVVFVGYIAVQLFPGSAELYAASVVTSDVLGAPGSFKVWAVIFMVFLAVVNLAGIKPFAVLEVSLTFLVAGTLLVVGIVGLAGAGSGEPISTALPDIDLTWSLLSALLGVAIFTFVGVEYTCPLAEELRRPSRDIPVGIFVGLGLIAVPVVLYGLAAARYVPPDVLATFAPTLPIDVGVAIFGEAGKWLMGITMILAAIGTLNAVLAGVPRILYGMAQTRQLPQSLRLPAALDPGTGRRHRDSGGDSRADERLRRHHRRQVHRAHPRGRARVGDRVRPHPRLGDHAQAARAGGARPYRSALFPIPQIVGIGLLALAAYKIAPPGIDSSSIYYRYLIFLGVSAAFSLVYNLYAFGSLGAIFRPVPLAEVYAETEEISEEIGVEVEPGGPHIHHDDH